MLLNSKSADQIINSDKKNEHMLEKILNELNAIKSVSNLSPSNGQRHRSIDALSPHFKS